MKVSGFTFLRNGSILGYPFKESILSVLPIVDEFIVALGPSEDDTEKVLKSIKSDKLKIIHTQWNEKMTDRGYVYGQQKMIAQFNCTGDWAFYLEADEVVHENDLDKIYNSMKKYKDKPVYPVLENIAKIIKNSALYKDKKTKAEVVRMKSLLDGFTKEEKIRFIYIDVLSRNLADEKIIEKEMQKELIDKGIRQM